MKDKDKSLSFDKFVKDIEKREERARRKIEEHQAGQEDHPARKYNRLYRELWQNRIKFRRK
tara:strand:+ start:265 stop:447 length:183 start_codon:yes stop_codon:yes gene_type:complete